MRVRRTLLFVAAALMLLSIPAASSAQWGRDRDRDRNGRGRNDNYDTRQLVNSAKRVDRLSGQLKGEFGDALDRSRVDGRDREDRLNELMSEFHSVAAQFRDRLDNGRDLNRASREAQRVLQLGWRLDQAISRLDLTSRVENKWSQVRSDLQVIQNAYGGYGYRR
jgi:hypothetical protein